ncbi:L-fucose-proton symporter [Allorhodopirellula solitaria]|uniref:L-fucose-proton symporter n=2 Tax=Allorhodopirellula solitaria TaxID=2527987 RepID=A0A5C5XS00_9BACT|nr:L-fucose-proton symporter [Allorhodopirellula solitaria]
MSDTGIATETQEAGEAGADQRAAVVPTQYFYPFVLVTTLFALWGFANNFTDPMVKVFKDVFAISNAQSSVVQMAFYGGYATMAIPAALFIRKFSYKAGILVGLALFATGALLSIPAANNINFWLFILGIYILTFGLAFLETTANPYILSMGPKETSTMRLNLAQAFNPMGSLSGAFIAATFVMTNMYVADFKADVNGFKHELATDAVDTPELNVLPFLKAKTRELNADANVRAYVADVGADAVNTDDALIAFREGEIESYQDMTFAEIQRHDLSLVSKTYMTLGLVVLATLVVFLIKKMPEGTSADPNDASLHLRGTLARLLKNPRYLGGVVTQMFYVGAQIMVWTFIIQYAEAELGMDNATAANHQIAALVIFLVSRFICTAFLKYVSPGKLLATLAVGGVLCTLGAIHITGMNGLYSLILVSACMSLMFPTIYGIALEGIGEDAKLGSAGLILAIVGAVWLTGFQGRILDLDRFMGTTATRGSFYLSVGCFIIIAIYGFLCRNPRSTGSTPHQLET